MKCLDHALRKWKSYIADSKTNDLICFVRMRFLIYFYSSGNFCKKVAVFYILIIFI